MNNTFSFSRFCAYAKAELFLHRVTIILALAIFIGVAFLVNIWDLHFHRELINGFLVRSNAPYTIGYVAMVIQATGSFNKFQKPGGGTFAMQMPVSTFEKYAARFTLSMIFLPLLAIFIPRVVWDICHACLASDIPVINATYSHLWSVLGAAIFVQSTFFLGSIFWRKQQSIKVAGVWVAFTILCVGVVYICKEQFGITRDALYPILTFLENNGTYIASALTLLFVTIAWVKFRKVQITK